MNMIVFLAAVEIEHHLESDKEALLFVVIK